MFKLNRPKIIGMICLLSVVLLSGISFGAKKVPVIAVVNKVLTGDPFLVTISDEAKRYGKENGLKVLVQAASSHSRADEQVSIIEDFIARNVDGIILLPCDSSIVVPAIKKANAAKIPVITVDTAAFGGKVVTHIATDNIKGSALAAEALIKAFKARGITKAKVAMIEGEPGQQTAMDRKKGFVERIKKESWIEIVASLTSHWTTPGGVQVMEDILQSHPDLHGVFSACDMSGIGAAQVIARNKKVDQVSLVTYDGLPEGLDLVKNGSSYADIAQYPKRMARKAIDAMVAITLKKAKMTSFPAFIDSGVEMVTQDKVAAFLKENW
jgi:ribose transport system substrate-binding protein